MKTTKELLNEAVVLLAQAAAIEHAAYPDTPLDKMVSVHEAIAALNEIVFVIEDDVIPKLEGSGRLCMNDQFNKGDRVGEGVGSLYVGEQAWHCTNAAIASLEGGKDREALWVLRTLRHCLSDKTGCDLEELDGGIQ